MNWKDLTDRVPRMNQNQLEKVVKKRDESTVMLGINIALVVGLTIASSVLGPKEFDALTDVINTD